MILVLTGGRSTIPEITDCKYFSLLKPSRESRHKREKILNHDTWSLDSVRFLWNVLFTFYYTRVRPQCDVSILGRPNCRSGQNVYFIDMVCWLFQLPPWLTLSPQRPECVFFCYGCTDSFNCHPYVLCHFSGQKVSSPWRRPLETPHAGVFRLGSMIYVECSISLIVLAPFDCIGFRV